MSKKMCEECFAIIEECDCEPEVETASARKKPRGKWEPNIKPNEKWFKVESDYTAYSEGLE